MSVWLLTFNVMFGSVVLYVPFSMDVISILEDALTTVMLISAVSGE